MNRKQPRKPRHGNVDREPDGNSSHTEEKSDWRAHAIYLEELLCHEQQQVQQLNEVVIELRNQVDQLQAKMELTEARMQWLLRNPNANENLPHEKPPHY